MAATSVTLTVLCENTAGKAGLRGEWGLSVWIDTGRAKVLFDAGENGACLHNSGELGVDLAGCNAIALSHGHYDHTGGLAAVLPFVPNTVPIYLHPAALQHRYTKAGDIALDAEQVRQIGMPDPVRAMLEKRGGLCFVENPTEIAPRVWVTGFIPRTEPTEGPGGLGALDPALTMADSVPDDMAVWIETEQGTLVVLGCAHAGVINTVRHVEKHSRALPIIGVVGGTHLRDVTPERMAATLDCLRSLPLQMLAACHCTGRKEALELESTFPEIFVDMSAGSRLQLTAR